MNTETNSQHNCQFFQDCTLTSPTSSIALRKRGCLCLSGLQTEGISTPNPVIGVAYLGDFLDALLEIEGGMPAEADELRGCQPPLRHPGTLSAQCTYAFAATGVLDGHPWKSIPQRQQI